MLKELKEGNKVCELQRALYGLKQASREWHTKIDAVLRKFGIMVSSADPCIYYKGQGKTILMIAIYVDDMIIASADLNEI